LIEDKDISNIYEIKGKICSIIEIKGCAKSSVDKISLAEYICKSWHGKLAY
jgi:hypothetical protein